MSWTTLSKPFYDEKFQNLNYVLDGRAVGNADIHPTAYISQNVFIGENVKIGAHVEILPGSVIMPNVEIAEATKIFPNVTIYPYTKIGKHCRLHAHVVVGADGFGYQFDQGEHKKIWHFSGVEIEDHVEIGATSTVDAGAFVATRIGSGTKIDNGVQVGHNAQIGRHCILCGQVAISGSVELEDYCVLGGMSGVAPGAILGKGTQVAAGSIISENAEWPSGSKLGGHPARELNQWMRTLANINKLGRDNEAR